MRRPLRDQSGFTTVELVLVTFLTVVLMAGLSNVFVSGLRASSTANTMLASQTSIRTALDRLEFETRCASTATLISSGAGVALSIPTTCPHATGTVSWCVTSGALVRYAASSCTGSGQKLATSVTSTRPFSCLATVGDYPELQVALAVNAGTTSTTAVAQTDKIAMRNAALTTSTTAACT
jgi:Tfp pilus assembly protein PilW